jgi:hypothetical protein
MTKRLPAYADLPQETKDMLFEAMWNLYKSNLDDLIQMHLESMSKKELRSFIREYDEAASE